MRAVVHVDTLYTLTKFSHIILNVTKIKKISIRTRYVLVSWYDDGSDDWCIQ